LGKARETEVQTKKNRLEGGLRSMKTHEFRHAMSAASS
jgi:hypothetical protein